MGQLAPLHARARAAWPTVELPAEPYYAFVAERLAGPDQLALLHTDDLYLDWRERLCGY